MTDRRSSRRRVLVAAAGLAVLGGCGGTDTDGTPRESPSTTRRPTTRRDTPTAPPTPATTERPTPRPRPRFESGPATCTVAGDAPPGKTWPLAGYDGAATRNPPAASAPNSLTLRRAWTVPTGATGPVLVDERRYYLRTRTALLALSPTDGRVRWRYRGPGPAGGVAVDADLVALPTSAGRLLALDPVDGSERWRVDVGARPTSPPLLTRDAVVLGTAGGVRAYAREGGSACFRVPTADPVSHLIRAGSLLVAASAREADGGLVAVDPSDEAVRYDRFLPAPPTGLLAAGGDLVVGVGSETLGLVPDDGTPRWTAPVGPVVAAGPYRYALGADELVALDDEGGVAWRADIPAPTGVAAAGAHVVVTGGTGDAALQVHDARTGRRRLRVLDAAGYRDPVVADDRFLLVGADRTRVLEEAA